MCAILAAATACGCSDLQAAQITAVVKATPNYSDCCSRGSGITVTISQTLFNIALLRRVIPFRFFLCQAEMADTGNLEKSMTMLFLLLL